MNNLADMRRTLSRDVVYPLLFYAVISLLMVGPFVLPATQIDTTSYDFQDSYIFLWNFWWIKEAVLSGENPYWTDAIFYPTGTSLAFHSYPLPYSLATIPIQLVRPGLDGLAISYNLVVFASFVVSGFAAYRLALFVTGSRSGALVAGLIYSFMPFHLLNASRLHVVALEFLPFYVLAQLRLEESPTRRNALQLGFWLAMTYYTSLEYALYLVLFSCVRLAWLVLLRRNALTRHYVAYVSLAAVLFTVIAGPLLYQQMRVYVLTGGKTIECPVEEAVGWSPAIASFVTPSRVHPIYGKLFGFAGFYRDGETVGMRSETTLNLTALILAAIAFFRSELVGRWFWGLAFSLFLVLALGPYLRITGTLATEIPMPWLALYETVPPFRGGREPARFFPLAMLMITVPAALGVQRLSSAISVKRANLLVTGVVSLMVLFEDLVRWPVERIEPGVHAFYSRLADTTDDFTIMDLTSEANKQLAQPLHRRKTVEWRGFVVRSELIDQITPFVLLQAEFEQPQRFLASHAAGRENIERIQQLLASAKVRYLLLPAEGDPAQIRLARLLGAHVELDGSLVICRF
jgi:hypothetical protein